MRPFKQYIKDNFLAIFISYLYFAIFINIVNSIYICLNEKQELNENESQVEKEKIVNKIFG